jgi:hypothetical protein
MELNEAKQMAYQSSHQAAVATEAMMKWGGTITDQDVGELVAMSRKLSSAALAIKAQMAGVKDPKRG